MNFWFSILLAFFVLALYYQIWTVIRMRVTRKVYIQSASYFSCLLSDHGNAKKVVMFALTLACLYKLPGFIYQNQWIKSTC